MMEGIFEPVVLFNIMVHLLNRIPDDINVPITMKIFSKSGIQNRRFGVPYDNQHYKQSSNHNFTDISSLSTHASYVKDSDITHDNKKTIVTLSFSNPHIIQIRVIKNVLRNS